MDFCNLCKAVSVASVVYYKKPAVLRNNGTDHCLVSARSRAAEHNGRIFICTGSKRSQFFCAPFHKSAEFKFARTNIALYLRIFYAVCCSCRSGIKKDFTADILKFLIFLNARINLVQRAVKHRLIINFSPCIIFNFMNKHRLAGNADLFQSRFIVKLDKAFVRFIIRHHLVKAGF